MSKAQGPRVCLTEHPSTSGRTTVNFHSDGASCTVDQVDLSSLREDNDSVGSIGIVKIKEWKNTLGFNINCEQYTGLNGFLAVPQPC